MLSETRDVELLAPEPLPTLPAPVPAPAPVGWVPERIRVPAADGFRAFAAISVVLYHCLYGAGLPPLGSDLLRNYLVAGFVGVDFFLVLSGFLLFLPAAARGRFGDVRSYALRRITRILPAYYVALVATVGLLLFLSGTRAYGLTRHNLALNLLLHATFLQHNLGAALGLPEGFGINGAVWTLSIEALFYAILPLVAVRFFRRPVIGLGLGLAIAAAWRLAVAHSTLHVASLPGVATPGATRVILITQFPSFAGHFALGMMAAWLFVRMRRSRFAGSPWTVVLQVLGLSGIILSMELLGHRDLAKTAGPLDHWTQPPAVRGACAHLLALPPGGQSRGLPAHGGLRRHRLPPGGLGLLRVGRAPAHQMGAAPLSPRLGGNRAHKRERRPTSVTGSALNEILRPSGRRRTGRGLRRGPSPGARSPRGRYPPQAGRPLRPARG